MILPSDEEVAARVAAIRAQLADGTIEVIGASSNAPYAVVAPDPMSCAVFEATRSRIADALGATALRIDHVGSTSIPGLAAKPIIDVQISVADITAEGRFVPALAAMGWPLRGREADHRYFRDPAGVPRRTHVHVCTAGSRWERVHLLFRDYLRTHRDRAREYGEFKTALVERYPHQRLSYTEAKGPFIDETLALAEAWAAASGWRP